MAERKKTVADSGALNQLILQLAMAFGQGAGSLSASGPSLDYLVGAYVDRLQDEEVREQFTVHALEFARAIGQVAATRAASSGRCVIATADVKFALAAIRSNTELPLAQCPITA